MKRLALAVAVVSFAAFAGAPTQPPTTTAPVAKKKSVSTAEMKTLGTGSSGTGSLGSGSLGTRGTGSATIKSLTPTPTK